MAGIQLEEEEIHHYFNKAQDRLGKQEISAKEYAGLAEESAAQGRYLAAAYYYHLAESQALPSPEAEDFKELTRQMIMKAEEPVEPGEPA